MDNLAQGKKCSSKLFAQFTGVEIKVSVVDCKHDDAAPPVLPHTAASSELFQNEPKSIEELYPSTGQAQTQRQNEVAY